MFLVDNPNVIHNNLIEYLRNIKHVIPKIAGWDNEMGTFRNIVAWSRYRDTNIFGLSESYINLDLLTVSEWNFIEKSTKLAKLKNPTIDFRSKIIYDVIIDSVKKEYKK